MKRGGFLKRKTPLKAKIREMAKGKPRWSWNKKGETIKRKPLKKVSKSRRRALTSYYTLQREFLRQKPVCGICLARGLNPAPATEVHHYAGRVGRLLTHLPFFIPSCRACREWPHENRSEAEVLGVIAPASKWNIFPSQ